jgi:hypothetical protein
MEREDIQERRKTALTFCNFFDGTYNKKKQTRYFWNAECKFVRDYASQSGKFQEYHNSNITEFHGLTLQRNSEGQMEYKGVPLLLLAHLASVSAHIQSYGTYDPKDYKFDNDLFKDFINRYIEAANE